MNISSMVEDLDVADWSAEVLLDLGAESIREHIDSFAWEKLHFESVINDFGADTRQGRYAQKQIEVIDQILVRLEIALAPASTAPARHDWSGDYAKAS